MYVTCYYNYMLDYNGTKLKPKNLKCMGWTYGQGVTQKVHYVEFPILP
jgi:hypothetical protein